MANKDYAYPRKNSKVSIYSEKLVKSKNEGTDGRVLKRVFLNPKKEPFWAYCNPIAQETNDQQSATFPKERVLVVINYIKGVHTGDWVGWGDRRLRIILPPDDFEGRNLELKLTCETVDEDSGEAIKEVYPS